MTALIWDAIGEHFYETGISKGVFYDYDGHGVAWNGLTSVEENTAHQVQPVYWDGQKFNDVLTIGDFSATLKAFTYPDEFLPYEGVFQDQEGFYITGQEPNRFGLSFQSKIGNDVEGIDLGYKIHVLYNLTANPTQKSYNTMSLEIEPNEFAWEITAIPEFIENFRPTAHVIFDSRKIDSSLLAGIEELLYGSNYEDPQLPSLKSLSTFIRDW
jgi:hypothetical protein